MIGSGQGLRGWQKAAGHAVMAALALGPFAARPSHAEGCDWPKLKVEVEKVVPPSKTAAGLSERMTEFRRQVSTGKDSLDVLIELLPAEVRPQAHECAFQASEHLSDKGFPPIH